MGIRGALLRRTRRTGILRRTNKSALAEQLERTERMSAARNAGMTISEFEEAEDDKASKMAAGAFVDDRAWGGAPDEAAKEERAAAIDAALTLGLARSKVLSSHAGGACFECPTIPPGPVMMKWDMWTGFLLIFVALVTPVEIGFLPGRDNIRWQEMGALFYVNRLVDASFIIDLVLNFFRQVQEDRTEVSNFWVTHAGAIRSRYLRGWFFIDFISCIPVDMMSVFINVAALENMNMLRLVRVLRILKLLRMMRGSRLLKRLEAQMTISYSTLGCLQFMFGMTIFVHWAGCMWGLAGSFALPTGGWIIALEDNKGDRYAHSPFRLYLASIHFAAMTLTTVGYGDISPYTNAEYMVCLFLQLGGCFAYAYVVGGITAIIIGLNPHTHDFKVVMDELNFMMADTALPARLRKEVRNYWVNSQHVQRIRSYETVLSRLSPALHGKCSMHLNRAWINKVWYFAKAADHFIIAISTSLNYFMFVPGEIVNMRFTLCVIRNQGMAGYKGRVISNGATWGKDFILNNAALIERDVVSAMSFLEVATLTRYDLDLVQPRFPQEAAAIRWACVWLTMQRGVLRAARRERGLEELMSPAELHDETLVATGGARDQQRRQSKPGMPMGHAGAAAPHRRPTMSRGMSVGGRGPAAGSGNSADMNEHLLKRVQEMLVEHDSAGRQRLARVEASVAELGRLIGTQAESMASEVSKMRDALIELQHGGVRKKEGTATKRRSSAASGVFPAVAASSAPADGKNGTKPKRRGSAVPAGAEGRVPPGGRRHSSSM